MSVPPVPPDEPLGIQPADQVTPRDVTWLWPGWLALGKLSLFEGDPGLGKSLIALNLCARLSTGRPWPDGSPGPGAAGSIYLSTEDRAEDTVVPRLRALGADLGRVQVRSACPGGLPRLPSQLHRIERMLIQTEARLLILDPITSFLDPGVQVNSDVSVRQALEPLAELAERHRCAPLLHRHLNKKEGGRALYRGAGSIAFAAACRVSWLAALDPGVPGRRVVAEVKNNLGPLQPSLAYSVTGQPPAPPELSWLGPSLWTADQLVARHAGTAAERARASDFLRSILKDGPRTAAEVWKGAEQQLLAARTLNRAKKDLQVRSKRVMEEGKQVTYWLLPGQRLPIPENPETREIDEALAKLEEMYPSAEDPEEEDERDYD